MIAPMSAVRDRCPGRLGGLAVGLGLQPAADDADPIENAHIF